MLRLFRPKSVEVTRTFPRDRVRRLLMRGAYPGVSDNVQAEGPFIELSTEGAPIRQVFLGITPAEFVVVKQNTRDDNLANHTSDFDSEIDLDLLELDRVIPLETLRFFVIDSRGKRFSVCSSHGLVLRYEMCQLELDTDELWAKWRDTMTCFNGDTDDTSGFKIWHTPFPVEVSNADELTPGANGVLRRLRLRKKFDVLFFHQLPTSFYGIRTVGVQTTPTQERPLSLREITKASQRRKPLSVGKAYVLKREAKENWIDQPLIAKADVSEPDLHTEYNDSIESSATNESSPEEDVSKGMLEIYPEASLPDDSNQKDKPEQEVCSEPCAKITEETVVCKESNSFTLLAEVTKVEAAAMKGFLKRTMLYQSGELLTQSRHCSGSAGPHQLRRSASIGELNTRSRRIRAANPFGGVREFIEKVLRQPWAKKSKRNSRTGNQNISQGVDTHLMYVNTESQYVPLPYRTGSTLWSVARQRLLTPSRTTDLLEDLVDDVVIQAMITRGETLTFDVTKFRPEDIAAYITSQNRKLLLSVTLLDMKHFLACNGKQEPRSIQNVTAFSDDVSKMVTTEVLKFQTIQKRVAGLQFFIEVCMYLRLHKDYQGLYAVLRGVTSLPVYRLDETWAAMVVQAPIAFSQFLCLAELFSAKDRYGAYIRRLYNCQKQRLPFLPWINHFFEYNLRFEGGDTTLDAYDESKSVDISRNVGGMGEGRTVTNTLAGGKDLVKKESVLVKLFTSCPVKTKTKPKVNTTKTETKLKNKKEERKSKAKESVKDTTGPQAETKALASLQLGNELEPNGKKVEKGQKKNETKLESKKKQTKSDKDTPRRKEVEKSHGKIDQKPIKADSSPADEEVIQEVVRDKAKRQCKNGTKHDNISNPAEKKRKQKRVRDDIALVDDTVEPGSEEIKETLQADTEAEFDRIDVTKPLATIRKPRKPKKERSVIQHVDAVPVKKAASAKPDEKVDQPKQPTKTSADFDKMDSQDTAQGIRMNVAKETLADQDMGNDATFEESKVGRGPDQEIQQPSKSTVHCEIEHEHQEKKVDLLEKGKRKSPVKSKWLKVSKLATKPSDRTKKRDNLQNSMFSSLFRKLKLNKKSEVDHINLITNDIRSLEALVKSVKVYDLIDDDTEVNAAAPKERNTNKYVFADEEEHTEEVKTFQPAFAHSLGRKRSLFEQDIAEHPRTTEEEIMGFENLKHRSLNSQRLGLFASDEEDTTRVAETANRNGNQNSELSRLVVPKPRNLSNNSDKNADTGNKSPQPICGSGRSNNQKPEGSGHLLSNRIPLRQSHVNGSFEAELPRHFVDLSHVTKVPKNVYSTDPYYQLREFQSIAIGLNIQCQTSITESIDRVFHVNRYLSGHDLLQLSLNFE